MKNDNSVPAVSVATDDELETVTGGAFLDVVSKAASRIVAPYWTPSDDFLFGASFDYPKGPIAKIR
jgi:hypothetical protein